MGDTLETAITIKQDLFTNPYKITINWGNYTSFENVFYTKVSRIRRLTKGFTKKLIKMGVLISR